MGSDENALRVGSNPCRTANFTRETDIIGVGDTETTQKTPDSETENMRFPKRIRHRGQVLATIYAKSKSYRNIKDQEQDALAPPCHNLPGFGRVD